MVKIISSKTHYTPEIEEFYVGFRYEFSDLIDLEGGGNEWVWMPKILKDSNHMEMDSPFCYDKLTLFRVKILDEEDLEELGWDIEPYSPASDDIVTAYLSSRDKRTFKLTMSDEYIKIVEKLSVRDSETLFKGVLLNFNELEDEMCKLKIQKQID